MLEISDKFSFGYFSYMISQYWFNILESFITILYDFEKHSGLTVLFERSELVPQKIISIKERGMKLFKVGKNVKITGA